MSSKKIDLATQSTSFCILPFTHMATKTYGDVKLCCRSLPIGDIKEQPLSSIWNSDRYKQIRKDMLSDGRPAECSICWKEEDVGVISLRQRINVLRQDQLHHVEKCSDDYSMPFEIPVLELKLSNLCNLKCRMCHPLDSSSWWHDWKKIDHLMGTNNRGTHDRVKSMTGAQLGAWDDPKFWNEFDQLIPFFEIVEFAGGEPLIDPLHQEILKRLAPYSKQIKLKYATNLTNIRFGETKFFEVWKDFHSIQLSVSIDGLDDVYDYIRQGAKWSQTLENIKAVKKLPNVLLIVQKTLQMYNIHQLPQFIDFFMDEIDSIVATHRVDFPRCLSTKCLPPKYRAKMIDMLQAYADGIKCGLHPMWPEYRTKLILNIIQDEIKILQNHNTSEFLSDFVQFSDILDKEQAVPITWRQLLPDLNEELEELLCASV